MTIETIKFFYNGIKINGEKDLIKMEVYETDNSVRIIYNWRWDSEFYKELGNITEINVIPARFWGDESTKTIEITDKNPLYNCFKYMALAKSRRDAKLSGNTACENELEGRMRLFPKYADIDTVANAKEYINAVKAEAEKRAEEERAAEYARRREIFEAEKAEKKTIIDLMNRFPVQDTDTLKVMICWSEHPAFYDWNDDELVMSVKAADAVMTKLDVKPEDGGYYKTKFAIIENDEKIYDGRYDLGDIEGGLIQHIENFIAYARKNNMSDEDYNEGVELIEKLKNARDNAKEIVVTIPDDLKKFIEMFKNNK